MSLTKHLAVEFRHEFRCRAVVYLPQTGHHPRRSGVHETTRQSNHSFSLDLFAERSLTSAEHDQINK